MYIVHNRYLLPSIKKIPGIRYVSRFRTKFGPKRAGNTLNRHIIHYIHKLKKLPQLHEENYIQQFKYQRVK